jgi:hypothetical protein
VSAGLDPVSGTATWLLQAIDPETGELVQDPHHALLPPNDAGGTGSGFVSYALRARADLATGAPISASARVLFDTRAPQDTLSITHLVDAAAPITTLTATPLAASGAARNYDVRWNAEDESLGSGVRHVTVYVAEDGGDFTIWLRRDTVTSAVYEGRAGHTYNSLRSPPTTPAIAKLRTPDSASPMMVRRRTSVRCHPSARRPSRCCRPGTAEPAAVNECTVSRGAAGFRMRRRTTCFGFETVLRRSPLRRSQRN